MNVFTDYCDLSFKEVTEIQSSAFVSKGNFQLHLKEKIKRNPEKNIESSKIVKGILWEFNWATIKV